MGPSPSSPQHHATHYPQRPTRVSLTPPVSAHAAVLASPDTYRALCFCYPTTACPLNHLPALGPRLCLCSIASTCIQLAPKTRRPDISTHTSALGIRTWRTRLALFPSRHGAPTPYSPYAPAKLCTYFLDLCEWRTIPYTTPTPTLPLLPAAHPCSAPPGSWRLS